MNKKASLKKSIVKTAIIHGLMVVGFLVFYIATDEFSTSSNTEKEEAERLFTQDRGRISDLNAQLDKSGIAEKRYLEAQSERDNSIYTSESEVLKEWFKKAIATYRLSSNFKLSLTNAQPSTNAALNGTNYEAVEHPNMKLEFNAITDTHSFSFLQDLMRNAPGLIVIDSLSMKRISDADKNVINLLQSGSSPFLIETKVTFNWLGLNEKTTKKPGEPAAK